MDFLRLRERLVPYLYTLGREAHDVVDKSVGSLAAEAIDLGGDRLVHQGRIQHRRCY